MDQNNLQNINRDELGKILIQMAREEMEQLGFVPDNDTLLAAYEGKFGESIKDCDLFDLEVLVRQNQKIAVMAEKKGIANIVRLTQAFDTYLRNKKEEKEKKTRLYLQERLEKMAA